MGRCCTTCKEKEEGWDSAPPGGGGGGSPGSAASIVAAAAAAGPGSRPVPAGRIRTEAAAAAGLGSEPGQPAPTAAAEGPARLLGGQVVHAAENSSALFLDLAVAAHPSLCLLCSV